MNRKRDYVRQFSVMLPNRVGAFCSLAKLLDSREIGVVGLSVQDSSDATIARLVLSDPDSAEELFMEQGIDADEVYIVPDFISEGYFTQEVIPRELELDGPTTKIHGKTLHYCDPVGIHPSMTSLILQRTAEVAPGVAQEESTLFIVGHGTGLNKNSTKSIKDQVELI
ncbi:hypothetical protein N9Z33_03570, partial [Akkermansiaceae bacterium]|nr:hypothetical protein [Akkermansiaceae bacterium]